MQTCSRCHTLSSDGAEFCRKCKADLREFNIHAVSLKKFKENTGVTHIRISVSEDSCPACLLAAGVYVKKNVPVLPVQGCSHDGGCRCFYDPILC